MTYYPTINNFGLLDESAWSANGMSVSTYHLMAFAHAANNLASRRWRWFEIAQVVDTLAPEKGATFGSGYFAPSDDFSPFGRLDLPKAVGYRTARGRVHIKVADQTDVRVTLTARTSKGSQKVTVGAGNHWVEFVLPVSPGPEDYFELNLRTSSQQLMSVTYGANDMRIYSGVSAFPTTPTTLGILDSGEGATRLKVYKTVNAGGFLASDPGSEPYPTNTLDSEGYDVEFYDSTYGVVFARRRIIDHYYNDASQPYELGQYFHLAYPLSDKESTLMRDLTSAGILRARIKERARWTIPSVLFWLER